MLPDTLERQVEEFIEEYKREMDTPFVSRLERQAIQIDLALTAPDSQTVIDALQQAASEQSAD